MYPQLKLENQLCFRLYTASRLVTQAYRPLLDPLGITYPQYLVLMVLWEHDNVPVGEITSRLRLDTNTVTPLLQRMEKEGLLVRNRGFVDGRQTIVSLTKRGRQLQEDCKTIPACLRLGSDDESLDLDNLKALAATLDNLIQTLDKSDEKQ
ncbi:MAG: MarR family transcriptional regulator [Bacteroidales bacterium]|nr:MarR family transcriptional regulator [Bacteroidales bacterium]